MNRLTEYAITGGSTKTVEYDDLGNITFKSDVGSYSYNASGPVSVRPHAVAAIVPGGGAPAITNAIAAMTGAPVTRLPYAATA
ncbi:MAG: hypothetical protein KF714_06870 [Parvibaculum sp.]|nr:hypothetical protein [Parvibaculum sp.]